MPAIFVADDGRIFHRHNAVRICSWTDEHIARGPMQRRSEGRGHRDSGIFGTEMAQPGAGK